MRSQAGCNRPSSTPWRARGRSERLWRRTISACFATRSHHKVMTRTGWRSTLTTETDKPPGTGRIEAFSDGVIAIIITIMVLELRLPADLFYGGHLVEVLTAFWPRLVVYGFSFLVVAI